MAYRAQVNGEAACRELARALVAAAERRGLLFVEKVRTLQMMRDRPFSQEVLRDWNAEESEAAEAEEAAAAPSQRARHARRAVNFDDFELDDDDEGLQLEPDDEDGWD